MIVHKVAEMLRRSKMRDKMSIYRISKGHRSALLSGCCLAAMGTAIANAQEQSDEVVDEIVVTGQVEFFRPTDASTATKILLPIVETPQAITVLTDDLLDLTAARDLEDTIGLVPGYVNVGSYGGFDNRFQARGFNLSVAEGILLNSVMIGTNVDRDLLGIERIEFLRGPTSITLGTLNYGGAINIVTRRPSDSLEIDLLLETGSFDRQRYSAEISGPLTESGSVRGYAGVAYETRNGFRNREGIEKTPVKAALDIDLSPDTILEIDFSYESGQADPVSLFSRDYRGEGSVPDFIPTEWNGCAFVQGCDNEYENKDVLANLRHQINDNLYVRASAGYATSERRHRFVSFLGLGGPEAFGFGVEGPYAFWYTYDDEDKYETTFTELALGGDFELGGQEHTFLLLGQYQDRTFQEDYQLQDPSTFFAQYANILTPTTDAPSVDDVPISVQPTFPWDQTERSEQNLSLTAQLILRPVDRLQILLGARYEEEEFDGTGINNGGSEGPFADPGDPDASGYDLDVDGKVDDTLLRAGIVYEAMDNVFAYFSYSEGFIPTQSLTATGEPIDPEQGTQYELGVKGEFMDGLVGASIAAFLIERDNVPSVIGDGVRAEPSPREQEHKGVELEVIGEVLPGLDVITSYSYLDTEITNSAEESLIGNAIPNAPKHLFNIFAQYQIPASLGIEGLSIGGGLRHVGEQEVDDDNDLQLDGYTLFEANLSYEINDTLTARIVGKNLTDEEYFVLFLGSGFAGWGYGETRSWTANLTASF